MLKQLLIELQIYNMIKFFLFLFLFFRSSKILIEKLFFQFYPQIRSTNKKSDKSSIALQCNLSPFVLLRLSFFIHLQYTRSIKSKANKGFKISIEGEMANRNSHGWSVYKYSYLRWWRRQRLSRGAKRKPEV